MSHFQRSTSPMSFARRTPQGYDISRLLDPAYASKTSNAFASTSAYVDRQGELHDPDYRHFPIAHPHPPRRTMARPRWETFDEDDDDEQQPRFPKPRPAYSYPVPVPVPHSFDSHDTVLDDDDSKPRSLFTRKRRSLDGTASSASSPYYTPSLLPDTPSSAGDQALARVHSHHSEPPYHHSDMWAPLYPKPRSKRHSEPPSPASASSHSTTYATPSPDTPRRSATPTTTHPHDEHWTPTCAQALRRQWQAVSLRVRFGVFRAQRRVRSRFSGL